MRYNKEKRAAARCLRLVARPPPARVASIAIPAPSPASPDAARPHRAPTEARAMFRLTLAAHARRAPPA